MISKKKFILYILLLFEFILIFGSYQNFNLVVPDVFKYIFKFIESIAFIALIGLIVKQKLTAQNSSCKGSVLMLSLLANYKIIYLYANNVLEIPFFVFAGVFIFSTIVFLILYSIIKLFLKNKPISLYSAVVIIFLLHFTSFSGCLAELFGFIRIDILVFLSAAFILILFAYLFDVIKIINFFKKIIVILLIFSIITPISSLFSFFSLTNYSIKTFQKKECKRDIYFILLDKYGGKDSLNYYGFDNSEFYNELKKRHFYVYENFDSNYNKTALSVPSILNCNYLHNLPMKNGSDGINKSLIFHIAKNNNYKICYLNPCRFYINKSNFYKLYNKNGAIIIDSISAFFNHSAFEKLIPVKHLHNEENRERFVSEVINDNNKKFVFFHFMMPHEPYLYDENGNPNSRENMLDLIPALNARTLNHKPYIGYLKYANKYTLNLVDKILKSSDTEPIIVIFGDHGIRKKYYMNNEEAYIDDLLSDEYFLKIYFNTFLAYYNPDSKEQIKAKTLVNFFREFMNENFGTELKPLEDKKYYTYLDASPEFDKARGFWVH